MSTLLFRWCLNASGGRIGHKLSMRINADCNINARNFKSLLCIMTATGLLNNWFEVLSLTQIAVHSLASDCREIDYELNSPYHLQYATMKRWMSPLVTQLLARQTEPIRNSCRRRCTAWRKEGRARIVELSLFRFLVGVCTLLHNTWNPNKEIYSIYNVAGSDEVMSRPNVIRLSLSGRRSNKK